MRKQRRVVATDRPQTGVVGQVATARRETAYGRHEIPSGRCDAKARNNSSWSGRGITATGAVASGQSGTAAKPQGDVWATSEGRNNLRMTTSGRRREARKSSAEQRKEQRGTAQRAAQRATRNSAQRAARNSARGRGRSGRRGAAAFGVGAGSGELPSGRRRNTVWTAKYRLDLKRNNRRPASSAVRQVRQGQRAASREKHVPLTDRSLLQFRSDTMSEGRRREEEDDHEVREREKKQKRYYDG